MVHLVVYFALCQTLSSVSSERARAEFQKERERYRREVTGPQFERFGKILGSATALADKGRFVEAEAACAEALALIGEDSSLTPTAKSSLAEVYAKQGMYRDALALWEKYPKGPEGLSLGDLQAICYIRTGQAEKAAKILEKYRNSYQRHIPWTDLPMARDESIDAVESTRLLVTGVALHTLTDQEKVDRLQAAYRLTPRSPVVNLFLAKALSRNQSSWEEMQPHFAAAYRLGNPTMKQRVVDELSARGRSLSDIGS